MKILSLAVFAFYIDHLLAVPSPQHALEISDDAAQADQVLRSHKDLANRSPINKSSCTDQQVEIIARAQNSCRELAKQVIQAIDRDAGTQGTSAQKKLQAYFKSSSPETVREVREVFVRVKDECGAKSRSNSKAFIRCDQREGVVSHPGSQRVGIANTDKARNLITLFPLFFDPRMPDLNKYCHYSDRATTLIHEMTHVRPIKGTYDYDNTDGSKGYGYQYVRSLSAQENLMHASTYHLFANAIYAEDFGPCDEPDRN